MPFSQDAVFVDTLVKALTGQIALDLSDEDGFKIAMFTDSVTPDFSQENPAYGSDPWDSGEVSGTGYSAGGADLTVISFAELVGTPGKIGWQLDAVSWENSTISGAEGALIYAPDLSNRAVVFRRFGQAYQTQDGEFQIIFPGSGVWRQNCVVPSV